jgi:N-acetylglucosaminyldiphosphoundecaprenol N-acetyl-beta-D-mannosaminyltransferase
MQNIERAAEGVAVPPKARPDLQLPARRILGMRVDCTSYDSAAEAILSLARSGRGGHVCVASVHMVMEAFDDERFRAIVNSAALVTPDGVPLVWTLRRRGLRRAQRVYGPTLTPVVCERASEAGIPAGFYGGSPETLSAMRAELQRRFPRLEVVFAQSPPFRALSEEEDSAVVGALLDSGVQILFVGLGCPKQERWMATHRDVLPCVQAGVGAAFDFIAGAKRQAPAWIQKAGLEWAFRLATEPRRLWRRYLHNNPRFVYQLLREELTGLGRGPTGREES